MATEKQIKEFESRLKKFMKEKLQEKYLDLNEASTRIIINNLLTEVLGYEELEDIRTEYRIKSDYADYVIQLNKKMRMVVEVKAMNIDISDRHLKQAFNYAVNEGIDWLLLTNGRQIAVYKVLFGKPPNYELLFEHSLFPLSKPFKEISESLIILTKPSFKKNEIDALWKAYQILSPQNLYKYFFENETIALIKRKIKKDVGINLDYEKVQDSILNLVNSENNFKMPKVKAQVVQKKKNSDTQ